jgi:hypothetical protein
MTTKFSEDTSTHHPHDPQLWLEAAKIHRPGRNKVYGMPIASAWEMKACRTISIVGTPYFSLNNALQNFDELVQKKI